MSTASSHSRSGSRSYDTGFPESFDERTTSMRHPDANTAPGAAISAEDVDPAKTLARSRRSFMQRHKRAISYGKITPEMQKSYNDSAIDLDASIDAKLLAEDSIGRPSKDGTDSIGEQSDASAHADEAPAKAEAKVNSHNRRRSLLTKWKKN